MFSKSQSKLSHSGISKLSYMEWHRDMLGKHSQSIYLREAESFVNGKRGKYWNYTYKTHSHPIWTNLGKKWYRHRPDGLPFLSEAGRRIKIVPRDLRLTPLSTCVWFMDDGCNCADHGNASFYTCGFLPEEVDFLVDRLKEDLGVTSKRRFTQIGQPFIFVGRKGYNNLMDCIKPYAQWDCFQYKVDTSRYNRIPQKGESHSMAKLTEEKVRQIFVLRSQGWKHQEIADKMGITRTNVSLILGGLTWGHLNLAEKTRVIKKLLNNEQREEILKLLGQGLCAREIAEQFNVDRVTVHNIKHRHLAKMSKEN